jgi:hypothetical protein
MMRKRKIRKQELEIRNWELKNYFLFPISCFLVWLILSAAMAPAALADKLEGGGNTVYDEIEGGGSKKEGGNFTIYDSITPLGDKLIDGEYTVIPGILGLLQRVVEGDWPWGTVPCTISREDSNVVITWDAGTFHNPSIYYLVVDDDTPFSTNFDDGWTEAQDGVDNFTITDGRAVHTGQVDAGEGVVVYRVLQAGVTPGQEHDGVDVFSSAITVGKVNITMHRGWNAVSVPFVGDSFGGPGGLVGDNFGEGDTANFWDYLVAGTQDFSRFKRFSAATGWDKPEVEFPLMQGAMFNIASLAAGETRVVTLMGTVSDADVTRRVLAKWNNLGVPFPMVLTNGGFVTANVNPSANLVVGDTLYEWGVTDFSKMIRYTGTEWSEPLNCKPGVSYWFNHVSTASPFDWTITKP